MKIHDVFPYLRVKGADRAITFYKDAFGATEKFRLTEPSGRVGHCELLFGAMTVMVSEEYPEYNIHAPGPGADSYTALHLHVDNADEMIARAVERGARVTRPAADQFYGERSGAIRDPFGHDWLIGHNLEELTPEEMQKRYDKLMQGQ